MSEFSVTTFPSKKSKGFHLIPNPFQVVKFINDSQHSPALKTNKIAAKCFGINSVKT